MSFSSKCPKIVLSEANPWQMFHPIYNQMCEQLNWKVISELSGSPIKTYYLALCSYFLQLLKEVFLPWHIIINVNWSVHKQLNVCS